MLPLVVVLIMRISLICNNKREEKRRRREGEKREEKKNLVRVRARVVVFIYILTFLCGRKERRYAADTNDR